MIDDETQELLELARKIGAEYDKMDPLVRFHRMVEGGIIDSEGRLRPEITGLRESDDQSGPSGK